MVSIENNPLPDLSKTYEKPNVTKKKMVISDYTLRPRRKKIVNSDESLINIKQEPAEKDPSFIDESRGWSSKWTTFHNNGLQAPRTHSKVPIPKDPERIKAVSRLPLRSMVYEAIRSQRCFRGSRPRDIKQFLLTKYGTKFEVENIIKVMQPGIEKGEILVLKRKTAKPRGGGRYRFSPKYAQMNLKTEETEESKPSIEFMSSNARENGITDVKNYTHELIAYDDVNKSNGQFGTIQTTDLSGFAEQETAEIKLDTPVVNGQSVNVLDLESIAQETNGDPINTDEIDFMVLHSLYCSSNPNGMRLDEIAEFIHSFYDIPTQRSLPCVKKYLNYGIEKGILFKTGDRYKKTFATWKFNSQVESPVNWPIDKNSGVGNDYKSGSNESSCTKTDNPSGVKLEPEELVSEYERMDMKALKIMEKKRNVKGNNLLWDENKMMKYETPKNIFQHKILPHLPRLGQLDDTNVALPQYIKVEGEQYYVDTARTIEHPFLSCIRDQVVPCSSGSIEPSVGERRRSKRIDELKASFQTVKCDKQSFSNFRCREFGSPHMQETHPNNDFMIKPLPDVPEKDTLSTLRVSNRSTSASMKYTIKSDLAQEKKLKSKINIQDNFNEPKFTLAEIGIYISRYSRTVLNIPSAGLLWEQIALKNNVPCLKLTGIGISSDENLYCKTCGSELKFGPLNCSVCFFEVESIVQKCNICHLICNRGDVFHKHLLWEHRPLIEEADYVSAPVVEENIGSLLNKLANNNLFRCGLCRFLTNTIEVFETHLVGYHTTRMNVFPPFPKLEEPCQVVILQNEISNTCCHKCNECGFTCNMRDFMVYHILDVHVLVENEGHNKQSLNLDLQPMKKNHKVKPNWRFGLCEVCGKFFNDVIKHNEVHWPIAVPMELDANANQLAHDKYQTLLNTNQHMFVLEDGILKKSVRRRRKHDPNKTFLCHICGKIVKRRLCEHIRIHNPEMYGCSVCGRKFNRYSNLITHRRVHTREKPFQCDICKMVFGYKCSIKGHIENVHSETVR